MSGVINLDDLYWFCTIFLCCLIISLPTFHTHNTHTHKRACTNAPMHTHRHTTVPKRSMESKCYLTFHIHLISSSILPGVRLASHFNCMQFNHHCTLPCSNGVNCTMRRVTFLMYLLTSIALDHSGKLLILMKWHWDKHLVTQT